MLELIKSISYDQGKIIKNILKLHVPDGKIVVLVRFTYFENLVLFVS